MVNYKMILLFFFFLSRNIFTLNEFSFHSIYEKKDKHGTYVRPAIGENGYLYILTGEDVPIETTRNRYLLKFDINSGTFIEQINYNSNYGFWRGDFIVAGENSEYLIITTFGADEDRGHSFEFFNIQKSMSRQTEYKIYGYRRVLKKVGSYYYYIYLNPDNHSDLIINRIALSYNSGDNFPSYNILKSSSSVSTMSWEAMVSCDFTKDTNYILCAYFTESFNVTISIFNSDSLNLIQTKELESFIKNDNDNNHLDHFIKIVYFKDNSKFVIMNSQNDFITRFRYLNFKNNDIINELYPIINENYLDIEETQTLSHDGENDLITADSYRIIKLFTQVTSNKIIITIIQFYENDSYFTIKIYNMYNNNGFNYMCQGRIAMFRNSFLICASASKNDLHRGGYFFINFPNSTDINLASDTIKLQNLISIENNLFSLNRKFKVLDIPKDFIFIDTSSSQQIQKNDVLDISHELKLRQYRIGEGTYILKYEAIGIGTDSGYRIMRIYPENKSLTKDPEIYIEGAEGSIKINLNNCLNGYYILEYDTNLCTNVKPKGYYLDTSYKIYKACASLCSECSGPMINSSYMNCLECKNNYYLTEDTKSCYGNVIDNYYLDNNILRRCHSNCKQCISKEISENYMNCFQCIDKYYMTEDTNSCYENIIENYYLDNNMLRRCHPRCKWCSSIQMNDNIMNCLECYNNYYLTEDTKSCYPNVIDNYYLDNNILRRCHPNCKKCISKEIDESHMNCLECLNNFYMTEDTNSCYENVIDNYYLDNNILRRCHSKCKSCNSKSINETNMNCLECLENLYLTEDTNSCYDIIIDNYYLDNNILRRCHSNCKQCISKEISENYMNCFQCIDKYYMTEDTNSCYENIIENYYLDNNMLRRCHPRCKWCSSIQMNDNIMNCLECYNNYYLTEDTKSCYPNVIDNYYLDNNILRRCHPNCKKCISKEIDESHMNCLECLNNFYMTEDTNSCYENVIDNYYLDNNILRRCHPNCKKCVSKEINETHMNCLECIDTFYLTEDTNSCYEKVIENYYIDYNMLRRCHIRCKWCYSGSINNEEMNCIECLNDEKYKYIYQNDTTNCILDSEFTERKNIVFNRLQNYNFYIVLTIFIISLIVGFINFCYLFINEEKIGNNDYNNIKNNEDNKDEPKDKYYELPNIN